MCRMGPGNEHLTFLGNYKAAVDSKLSEAWAALEAAAKGSQLQMTLRTRLDDL